MRRSEVVADGSADDPRTVQIFDYMLSVEPLPELASRVVKDVTSARRRLRLFALNPAKVVFGERDPKLHNALMRAEVLFADGYGVCWASRLLSGRTVDRVPGVELATELLGRASDLGWGVYLLGGRPDVNQAVAEVLPRRFPGISVVGAHHGFFDEDEERQVVGKINCSTPQILLVALGSPAQELWIDRFFEELNVSVAMGVGGTFDVYAGAVRRAPAVWRQIGLEWLYRVLREPRRIERFLNTHPRFMWRTLRTVLGSSR